MTESRSWSGVVAWVACLAMTLLAAGVPFLRAFYRVEIDYNEGWNIYNAATVAAHGWLYPAKYGWTSVNYPMLSFVIMALLHRVTHEYLFTARVVSLLSLLASGTLVAVIVHSLSGKGWRAPVMAGMFVVAVFCANADYYVGMDDPQMFAQVFFLAGLYVYVCWRDRLPAIALVALLFVVGGFIKHNPIDFPLAVLLDLLLVSRWRAAWFSVCGFVLVAAGLALNVHYGGPHFIDQLLAPRSYSWTKAALQLRNVLGPILLPVGIAIYMAWRLRGDRVRRVAAIFLAASMLLGGYFGGGNGVSVNSLFSATLAVAILLGLLLEEVDSWSLRRIRPNSRPILEAALFLWLLIPLVISGNWNVRGVIRETRAADGRFDDEVEAMAAQPGLALCESLLRCYAAGKPYIYDPFNATRLVELGEQDQAEMLRSIEERKFGVIQLGVPLGNDERIGQVDPALRERFTPEMLRAIQQNYMLAMQDADAALYVPASK
ncbi:hypothetical protein HDF16_001895 [Granulicella aggregans]|uniref:Dolichyl-phosphate-mannose-protein mannosyltransferase n=1 Tax=Granulicella aggregans TaxID=474949 RepID=A0A7W7ZC68_9BACT|nr:hypothetical protein [Granulicella aggregans]MBB5057210.1 hypothetical protein [Granulicella aggregans]